MSQDAKLSSKEKKAQRDAERRTQRGQGKKRKHAETEDLPQDGDEIEQAEDFVPLKVTTDDDEEGGASATAPKPESRKRKAEDANGGKPQKEQKQESGAQRKKRKRMKQAEAAGEVVEEGEETPAPAPAPTKSRFIVFVGNLPYAATDASIETHFKKLQPFKLRHRTDPKTKKSKGFAFLEFEGYDRMKTCLKLYHHSMFDPAKKEGEHDVEKAETDPKKVKGGRKINVELTAGGGGKNEGRKEKIQVKNERLEGQRTRRAELEKKEKAKTERKKSSGPNGNARGAKPAEETEAPAGESESGIHPSRLAQMNKK